MPKWDREKIIKAYIKVCTAVGKILGTSRFRFYRDLPSACSLYKNFENLYELQMAAGFITRQEYEEIMREKNKKKEISLEQFCDDCLLNPQSCNEDVQECKEEAKIYFELGNKTFH